ncbi:High affinity cAMP-specific 3',5'-cyclic phosphodiesterase 7A [Globomyces sp. JEL0801]|nr:High affinity cAMP-specific 3',5'-cyclic phosphodiesterase 7A [Globomyces sp. JEL0801]
MPDKLDPTVMLETDHDLENGPRKFFDFRFPSLASLGNSDGISNALDAHLLATQKQISWKPWSLEFTDPHDELLYSSYVLEGLVKRWVWVAITGMVFLAAFQIILDFAFTIPNKLASIQIELILIPLVHIPLLIITCLGYYMPKEWRMLHLHKLSLAFVIFSAPVFMGVRTLLYQSQGQGLVTAPFYITVMFSLSYFFRMRFIYIVGLCLVSFPVWVVSAALSLQNFTYPAEASISENWLFNELARGQKESHPFDDLTNVTDISGDISQMELITMNTSSSSAIMAERLSDKYVASDDGDNSPSSGKQPSDSNGFVKSNLGTIASITALMNPETCQYLEKLGNYNFPIFDFAKCTENRPLSVMSYQLVVNSGLLDRLQLSKEKFMLFMTKIELGYDSNLAFHNSIHATDVLHGLHHLNQLDKIKGTFSDLEMLASYVAASVHDFDHPGVNNHYLTAIGDKRALLYNDKSVLENHHCSSAFRVLMRPETNFLDSLDKKSFKSVRSIIIDMVLATDLAQHFDLLTRFKKKVVTGGTFDPYGTPDDRQILMQVLIKCADVSNPTKEWPIYEEWIRRITVEFFNQGDLERQRGLPISPFCNREQSTTSTPGFSAQPGFINFIVYPLYEALDSWTPILELKDNLNASRQRFCEPPKESTPTAQSPNSKRNQKSLKLETTQSSSVRDRSLLRSATDITSPSLAQSSSRRGSMTPTGGRRASLVPNFARNIALFQTHSRSQSSSALHTLASNEPQPQEPADT